MTILTVLRSPEQVLSVWGSLGAEHMNAVMLELIPLLTEKNFRLIHVTGKRYYPEFSERLREAAPDYSRYGVEVLEYLHDMPRVMAASDLMICRAGASTLSELAYIGMPSILVPSPNVVANHQEKNARVVEEAGGARVLLEGEFTAQTLLDEIRAILEKGRGEKSCALSMGKGLSCKLCLLWKDPWGILYGGVTWQQAASSRKGEILNLAGMKVRGRSVSWEAG